MSVYHDIVKAMPGSSLYLPLRALIFLLTQLWIKSLPESDDCVNEAQVVTVPLFPTAHRRSKKAIHLGTQKWAVKEWPELESFSECNIDPSVHLVL